MSAIEKYKKDIQYAFLNYTKLKETGESFYNTNRDCAVAIWAVMSLSALAYVIFIFIYIYIYI